MKKGILLLFIFIHWGCSMNTTDFLNGEFIDSIDSTEAVILISPVNGASGFNDQVLIWSQKSGSLDYILEIATDNSFTNVIFSKTTRESSFSLTNVGLSGGSYFWRIKVRYPSKELQGLFSEFNIVSKTEVYVDVSSAQVSERGHKTAPFKSIASNINSRNNSVSRINVAKGVYYETLRMYPNIAIYGGYAPSSWTRDAVNNVTEVVELSSGNLLIFSSIPTAAQSTTIIDGFNFKPLLEGAQTTNIGILGVNSSFIVRNCKFYVGSSVVNGAESIGMRLEKSHAILENVELYSGLGSISNGVNLSNNSSLVMTGGKIETNTSITSNIGLTSKDSTFTLNSLSIKTAYANIGIGVTGVDLKNSTGSINNIEIESGYEIILGNQFTVGISLFSSTLTVDNVKILTGVYSSDATGMFLGSNANLTLRNSTIKLNQSKINNLGINITDSTVQATISNTSVSVGNAETGFAVGIKIAPTATVFIDGSYFDVGSGASSSTGMFSQSSNVVTKNSVFTTGSAFTSNGIKIINALGGTYTNNIFISGPGLNSNAIYLGGVSNSLFTNNILVTSGVINLNYGIFESVSTADFSSLENNAFWNYPNGGLYALASDENTTDINTIFDLENLTDATDGPDKHRGNFSLSPGYIGNPFTNFPKFMDAIFTTNASTTILKIENGNITAANYTIGDFIEINQDGVSRKITAINSGVTPDEITIDPPLSSVTLNQQYAVIYYWDSRGSTCYTNSTTSCPDFVLDLTLQKNSLSNQMWYNLIYGGKDTSTNNCGEPLSGPGIGAGKESCGSVTTDMNSVTRTTGWPVTSVPNNNTVPNATPGATAAVPSGYSIGPFEKN